MPKKRKTRTQRKRSVRLPRRLVSLGRCVELQFVDGRVWSTGRRRIELCSSESGKTLWIMGVSREKKREKIRSALYRRYTGYLASGVRTARVREPSKLTSVGRVSAVVYESAKWDRKKREYVHHFRSKPIAWTDKPGDPTFIKISGGRIRVRGEGITG